jgi:type IV pilus assembly protein PilP
VNTTPNPDTPRRLPALAAIAGIALCLGACVNRDMSDLREFVSEVKQRPGGRIEPLPEVKSYESFEYTANERRSPFMPDTELAPPTVTNDAGISPDRNRNKEYLESFPLDSLRMVGTLEIDEQLYGLVQDGDGLVHRIQPGNHLGEYDGKVSSVSASAIELTEIVPDGLGGYLERAASVALSD